MSRGSDDRQPPRSPEAGADRAGSDEVRHLAADIERAAREVKEAANRVQREAKEAAGDVQRTAREVTHTARELKRAAREVPAELIWSRPAPGSRRPRLTREEIAAAALAIADAEGLAAVSMRRVASELEVGTMSLYHYVKTKDELLALMHDAMMGELLVPPEELPSEWRAALELTAQRSRAAFRRHPWAIEGPPGALGPNAMRHFEQSLVAVDGLQVDFETKFELITMVDDYVFGVALRERRDELDRRQWGGRDDWVQAMGGYIDAELASGSFPQVERMVGGAGARAAFERLTTLTADEQRFERGLRRVLDGIALDLERRQHS